MLRTIIILLLSITIAPLHSAVAGQKIVRIGVGSLVEGYHSMGSQICRYISESNEGVKCELVPTSDSREALWLLHREKIDFAFTLSNLALQSYSGKGYFVTSKPFKDMRQLLRLHDEYFTVIVRDGADVKRFADLAGMRLSNGPPKSDSSVIYKALDSYYDFKNPPIDIELAYEDYAKKFCGGAIDAIMIMTGHPSSLVNYIAHTCRSNFITIESDKIDLLLRNNPGFRKVVLESGVYPNINESHESVAVSTIFVVGKSVDEKIVANFLERFKKEVSKFKATNPVLYDLKDSHFMSEFVLPKFKN